MEKFMFLFRGGDTHVHNAEDSKEVRDYIQLWTDWMQGLGEKGILAGGDPLQTIGKQVSGINKDLIDGPYLGAKEMVGGYLVINAKDIDAAVEISMGCPIFMENGKVEVRQIQAQGK